MNKALEFIEQQGIVLESARGPVPRIVEWLVEEPLEGSWWQHPRAHEIFRLTRALRGSDDVLACRLVDGKVTYVHRRLWPALARLESLLPGERTAAITEVHTDRGHHEVSSQPLSEWLPREAIAAGDKLSEEEARELLDLAGLGAAER